MILHISVLLLAIFVLTNCEPKQYIYYYEKQEAAAEPIVKARYTDNDFRVKCDLSLDSVIKNKKIVAPLSLKLFFLGRYQYYPKNLRFELYGRIKTEKNLPDSLKYFEVISVYPRYYLGNKTNPETVHIKVKLIWDTGEKTAELNYILQKVEYTKEEYRLPIRPYG